MTGPFPCIFEVRQALRLDYPVRAEEPVGPLADDLEARMERGVVRPRGEAAHRFALAIRNETGTLLGGLVGETRWTALYVSAIWVRPEMRHAGYGRALVRRAEEIARARQCEVILLNTPAQTATTFLLKCGFEVVGELDAAAAGPRTWFARRLATAPAIR